jgi:hypothetical protein
MGRVSAEALKKLNDFILSLPEDARSKCALCNETLTHIVKQAEAQTGAGTATVTRVLSERINEGAAPGDRVSGEQLRQKALRHTGERFDKCADRTNNPDDTDRLIKLLKRAARLAQKIKSHPNFSVRKSEIMEAASAVTFTLTETREGVKWV